MVKVADDGTDHSRPIRALAERHRAELEAIGWTVILLSDTEGGSLCLHPTKDGEVRKLPTVMLACHPIRCTLTMLELGKFARSDVRRLPKPWEVRSRMGGQGGKWKDEASAVEAFLREASTYP